MSSRETWKAEERHVARRMGGERVPVTGRGRGDAPDVRHPLFSVELKSGRNALSAATILLGLEQAAASAAKDGKEPIVVCCQKSGRGRPVRRVVCWEFESFCEYFGLTPAGPEPTCPGGRDGESGL